MTLPSLQHRQALALISRASLVLFCWIVLTLNGNTAAANDYTLIDSYPHYSGGFTQGLLIHEKMLYESSGLYGRSFLIYGDLRGGHRQLALPADYFAEGVTILNKALYLLTWKKGEALVFDPYTLEYRKRFHYTGEGWGLTDNGTHLIMSDGSDTLRFLNPDTFEPERTLRVRQAGKPVHHLNELEWHQGMILANRWQTNHILVIDEPSGEVVKTIDLTSLYPPSLRRKGVDVMNGIAYDSSDDTWLITGKHWPRIYRVKLMLSDHTRTPAPSPVSVSQPH
ncbi:glutaminyl-peptide cyclotransferase [Litorivivens sp.]|uniref:glutaminyl-peptide cyclotransferase n=1 Tax=Litorivivens sp. TaxID=2020868 RepID=UPI003568CD85